ncbi:hypothetical protein [Kangiella sp. TOML190]|uniref:hypothetical protein n=1 Tax=Kangiella sp. TOML190 TaxID=2931351 RepID=UPI00203F8429|nr:hypothetical protein [Kangiella sp. TOML190]
MMIFQFTELFLASIAWGFFGSIICAYLRIQTSWAIATGSMLLAWFCLTIWQLCPPQDALSFLFGIKGSFLFVGKLGLEKQEA